MNSLTKALVIFVIIVHILFFVLEAMLWMQPLVHDQLIALLNNPVTLSNDIQAVVLKNLFMNQGFYNLFLVIAGFAGLNLVSKEKQAAGYALLLLLCFSATGAGIVLVCSTKAYILAFFQAVPAAVAFTRIILCIKPRFKKHNLLAALNLPDAQTALPALQNKEAK